MDINMHNNLELSQKLLITPKLEQALNILQMSTLELSDHIQQSALENPVIEINDTKDKFEAEEKFNSKMEWLKESDEENKSYYQSQPYNNEPVFTQITKEDNGMEKILLEQLNTIKLSDNEYTIGSYIIQNLNKYGFLEISTKEIAENLSFDEEEIIDILEIIIHNFDPCGIGARDLKECLKLQLMKKNLFNETIEEIIDNYLEYLAENKLNHIAKKMKITLSELVYYCDIIKTLNPKPGSVLNEEKTEYIVPDIVVIKKDNNFIPILNDSYYPKITINSFYKNELKNKCDSETNKYLNKKFEQALWIYKCINQRKETLLNVCTKIIEKQNDFFVHGPGNLQPMILKNIADELSIHESTVSRAVNNKWIQCSWGMLKLKYMFSASLNTSSSTLSSDNVKHTIMEIIDNEDKKKPLSDQKITDILNKQNISISRRTIAKYREEMNIPNTVGRKKYV